MTVLPGNVVASYEKVIVLPSSDHIKELHTVLRDKNTDRSEFVFCADRLMRLVIEEGLNQLPFSAVQITTPTGCEYDGIAFTHGNCGVSICRSGEVMEHALRMCCRSIRTGLTVCKAANVLIQNGVAEENIILLSVFSTPNSIKYIRKNYANMTVITSEMNANVPHSFTTRYFGTD
ncbi:hypothetical protein QR680_009651 [Steinernema hermaphroditum]|uniref:Phosphoribosyltransferase domain-containing protein n=1 Tax=Steinernema hermaphroditum TaxID=289476 RepID=A0AA39MAA9_9BILA|nr:hypothetical protein QR680_009651 [Steinernema hermaphroditum]